MQDAKDEKSYPKLSELSTAERSKLVDAFAWFIKEDKKQNPAFYQAKKQEDD